MRNKAQRMRLSSGHGWQVRRPPGQTGVEGVVDSYLDAYSRHEVQAVAGGVDF